jgi:heme oxygenase
MSTAAGDLEGMVRCTSMRSRLRNVTQSLHRRAESHFGLQDRTWDRDSYRTLLERLWGFHAPLEDALMRLDWRGSTIAMDKRRKRAWLEADLLYLGVEPDAFSRIATCRDLPAMAHLHDGIGALYVVEGATLGGQVILRALQTQLDISPLAGGHFFASHGRAIGAMWRSYLDVLEEAGKAPHAAEATERAAMQTFSAFDRWFDPASHA